MVGVVGVVAGGGTGVGGRGQSAHIAAVAAHADDVRVGVVAAERGDSAGTVGIAGDDPFCWNKTLSFYSRRNTMDLR